MKAEPRPNRPSQWLAAAFAGLASMFTLGGTLVVAEHYAQTATSHETRDYDAAQQSCHTSPLALNCRIDNQSLNS